MTYRAPRLWLLLALCVVALPLGAADAPAPEILKTLRPAHPRLFVLPERWDELKAKAPQHPLTKQWLDALKAGAEKMLAEKPVVHVLQGPRLLTQSRNALRRISTLAAMYRLTGDARFADRARVEMLTAAAFKDWNPSHFLDVGEMTTALAIGYDWLYDQIPTAERKTIREAIITLGLNPGLDAYQKGGWWTKCDHNWGQVCNGGMTVGALAIADEEPALAAQVLDYARKSIDKPMHAFAPDGGCAEGPGYWGYATQYHVYYLAALETALGTDFGQRDIKGFPEAGFFRAHACGPVGKLFNFADAGAGIGKAPQMFWLARTFKQPAFAAHEIEITDKAPTIFHLLWFPFEQAGQLDVAAKQLPLDAYFRGVNVAFFRSAWSDPNALYVGFKGGDNAANHSHLDLGSFVLDAHGVRWADDLGGDNYNLPGYFGKQRWSYYRLKTEGHNTLTLNGENQAPRATAPIIAYHSTRDRAFAVADLTHGYKPAATKVWRGVAVLNRTAVLVQDEIESPTPVEPIWRFHTTAKPQLDGAAATLTLKGQSLRLRILAPAGAKFDTLSASPTVPEQAENKDTTNLIVRLPAKVTKERIAVLIETAEPVKADVEPLEAWVKMGAVKE